ncbi:MAG TPA: hypothetical protein VMF12_08535 [Xanthobacteraceae bacterium]|jgi:hypothetical protein|nr:hypothetical protein [Xanthobacteraceae bacterium]HUC66600.1 hypothetical protein [Stellaceae bacterium]
MTIGNSDYLAMVREWRTIFAEPISDEEKQEACFDVLRRYIEQKAISCARHPNPCTCFYAVMLSLRGNLMPRFARDEFGKLVILPMWRLVEDWVRRNAEAPVGTTTVG